MSTIIRIERWSQVWPECEPLMRAHSEEVYGAAHHKPFAVDTEMVMRLEYAENSLILAARDPRGKLVGYAFWIVGPDIESAGRKVAIAGPWYVLPEYRDQGVGRDLMVRSEAELAKMKIGEMCAHAPIKNGELSTLGRWLMLNGWKPQRMQYVKVLEACEAREAREARSAGARSV